MFGRTRELRAEAVRAMEVAAEAHEEALRQPEGQRALSLLDAAEARVDAAQALGALSQHRLTRAGQLFATAAVLFVLCALMQVVG